MGDNKCSTCGALCSTLEKLNEHREKFHKIKWPKPEKKSYSPNKAMKKHGAQGAYGQSKAVQAGQKVAAAVHPQLLKKDAKAVKEDEAKGVKDQKEGGSGGWSK